MENYNSPPPPYDETQSITNKENSTTPSATFIPIPQSYGTLPDSNNGNPSNQPDPYMFQPHLPNISNPNQSNYISQLPPSPPLGQYPAEMYCQYCQARNIFF
uniref:LITAF domain-containing protein n=1 Tax=Acrobeloides nanus TaxID=290746 RepID=A0A914CJV1_9BILA